MDASPEANETQPAPVETPAAETTAPPRPPRPATMVRYGRMGYVGEFTHPPQARFAWGAKVVVQTDRGIELGEPIHLTCPSSANPIPRDQMLLYAKNSGSEYLFLNAGRILRQATDDDLAEARHLRDAEIDKIGKCAELVEQHGIQMKIVDCEHLFGGERIIFYFMAEGRIDFRDLVRDLAREFQTRIEMRQVGARDEARLIADFETCGRECCCKNFLKTLKPVNMKMAKMQKATLDPSKVSGRCGRLKCCLRYEQDTYDELDRRLPRMGCRVATPEGEGFVIDRLILAQVLLVQTGENQRVAVPVEQVTVVEEPPARRGGGPRNGDRPREDRGPRNGPPESANGIPPGAGQAEGDLPPPAADADDAAIRQPDGERRGRRRRGRRGGAGRERSGPAGQPPSPGADNAPQGPPGSD